jgi:FkbM family methyltransferase
MENSKLVFDIGMHMGEDSEFYLSRGCRVVGVEANPELLPLLREKFASELKDGRLHIVDKAISDATGTVRFAVNSDSTVWGSISPAFIARGMRLGSTFQFVEVRTIRFEDLLGEYGTPYYLKVDIEGMDMACIEALHRVRQRPRYVSLETRTTASIAQIEGGFSELAHLWVLGYRDFKYVDQAALAKLEGASLQAEGPLMRYTFRKDSSGPFGEESPGEWLQIDAALKHMRRLICYQNTLGLGGRHYRRSFFKAGRWIRRHVKRLPTDSWYDLHARLG